MIFHPISGLVYVCDNLNDVAHRISLFKIADLISVRELCKVLFPYPPSNEDELELKEGDIISIINRELPDKGWWKGELRGKIGVFPDNFVVPLSPDGIFCQQKALRLQL